MKLFKNRDIAGFFGLNSQDDEYDEHIFEDELVEEDEQIEIADEPVNQKQQESTEMGSGVSYDTEKLENTRNYRISEEPINRYKNEKVVKMDNYQSPSSVNKRISTPKQNRKISVYEPRAYKDCQHIAEALFRKEIVIVTFTLMEEFQARRVVDFVTGTIYAIDGDIQRIGDEIFICTPANVDIDSSVAKSLVSTHLPN